MKEIKFRAKTVEEQQWVYGFYVEIDGHPNGIIYEHNGTKHDVDKKTLGQYIGHKDIHQKEIYGQDIMQWDRFGDGDLGLPGLVVMENDQWQTAVYIHKEIGFEHPHPRSYGVNNTWEEGEIIGNIFDHPHLLVDDDGIIMTPPQNS